MDNVLGYCVFDAAKGNWLQSDEKTWGKYIDAAMFMSYNDAKLIADRETNEETMIVYIMAVM